MNYKKYHNKITEYLSLSHKNRKSNNINYLLAKKMVENYSFTINDFDYTYIPEEMELIIKIKRLLKKCTIKRQEKSKIIK